MRDEWSQLVLEWQEPLYNLALRIVGNRDDAADATQEVFMTIFAQWNRYDPARPLRPWLYRVAHNTLFNFVRGRSRARAAAASAPPRLNGAASPEHEGVERNEESRAVEAELAALPADARTLLFLHYYHDLTQVELAEILDVPRTTLQSRLAGALDALRHRLAGAGQFAALPLVESVLRGAAPVPVPPAVTTSLLNAASQAAATAASATAPWTAITIGGLMTTKKAAFMVLGIAIVCSVGAGWIAARATREGTEASIRDHAMANDGVASRGVEDELRAKNNALSVELHALVADNERLAKELRELAAVAGAHGSASPPFETPPDATDPQSLDWTRFAALFTERVDDIDAVIRGEPNPESEAAIFEAIAELSRLSNAARARAPQPLYDPEILRGFARATFGGSLELDAAQLRDLDFEVDAALARTTSNLDVANLSPAERSDLRKQLMREILSAVEGIADEEQRPRVEVIGRIMEKILGGNRRDLEIAVGEQSDDAIAGRVAEEWRLGLRLSAEALARLTPIAAEFWRDVKSLLDHYGQNPGGSRALSEAEQAEIREQTTVLQIIAERKLLELLSESELANVRDAVPVLFSFNYSGKERIEERRGHGYF